MTQTADTVRPAGSNQEDDDNDGVIEEKAYRSIVKAVSWRATGTLDTMIISYLITGNLTAAASIGFLEVFTKMVLYYFHERIWSKIKLGLKVKRKPPPVDYEI